MEQPSPVDEKPPAVDDVEWMTKKLIPIFPDLEERACEIFQWDIKDWRALDKRVTGPEFEIGGYKWRILLFPQGNNSETVSVYLDSAEPREQQDPNWHVCAQFALLMSNPNDPTVYTALSAHHRFTVEEADWGFTRFIETRKLELPLDPRGLPLMDKGHTIITAYVRVYEDPTGILWHNFVNYDSKQMTGYVGLKNQGATCYMNSLLQSLFFTNYFRKAVFDIPTDEDEPSKSVSLALQRVFYQLATSDASVGTTELTRSFGWNSLESFMQHDVQEFNRVLQDNLEGKMKGTAAEGAIQKLFVGKMKSYIKCINVNYESSRVENFYDIQLNVKGCKTLHDSFNDYIAVETLDGDNKYHAEGHGLQDARKGVIFETLPPILHLQLKRFEYDIERDAMVKINDRHEFPLEIDLADFVAEGEEKDKVEKGGFKYTLHGVLVHSGDLHGGHYFALLKPERDGKWYKFDDDRVTIATMKEVLDENYGGGEPPEALAGMPLAIRQLNRHRRFTNAYMLVYIQNSAMNDVLKPVTPNDIPEHLLRRLEDERLANETKQKERHESMLYCTARVISDIDFKAHDGVDLFDPHVPTSGKVFKVKKADKFSTFREMVAATYDRTVDQIRIWVLVKRQNDTIRTDIPIQESDFNTPMEIIKEKHGTRTAAELRFYVEFMDQSSSLPIANPKLPNDGPIMIFLKYYDPYTTKLEGIGRLHVQKTAKVGDIIGTLNERKGFPPNTPLKLCEEIKPTMIEPMKMKSTFQQCEIQGGDIIVFQKDLTPKELGELKDQNAKASIIQYYEYIFNRIIVEFKPKNDEGGTLPTYSIELSRKSTYDQVAAKLAEKLGVDPLHIQFTTTSSPSGLPKNTLKRSANLPLQEMLVPGHVHLGNQYNVLFYEKLDMSIVELESKRLVKVTWVGPTLKDESQHELLLLKTSTMSALAEALLPKVKLDPNGSQKLRIIGVFNGKLLREYTVSDGISTINDNLSIYAEEIPRDEIDLKDGEKPIQCFHFQGEISRTHGIPFRMVVKENETFGDMKTRIRARLGMAEKDFAKVKFLLCQGGAKVNALNDDDVLSDVSISPGDSIGLDHIDKSGRSNRLGLEKAITIRG
ncbi:MAG: ubiquitin carboxyl-terminal hydrolase 5 [Benniella sp.]|nr:MAG: ubiquitin carboxyl-terminal hydrolase 5 [Benniella sp.]